MTKQETSQLAYITERRHFVQEMKSEITSKLVVIYFVTHHLMKHLVLGCGTAVYNGILSQHEGNNAIKFK
jgi:hypothetical protein